MVKLKNKLKDMLIKFFTILLKGKRWRSNATHDQINDEM